MKAPKLGREPLWPSRTGVLRSLLAEQAWTLRNPPRETRAVAINARVPSLVYLEWRLAADLRPR